METALDLKLELALQLVKVVLIVVFRIPRSLTSKALLEAARKAKLFLSWAEPVLPSELHKYI